MNCFGALLNKKHRKTIRKTRLAIIFFCVDSVHFVGIWDIFPNYYLEKSVAVQVWEYSTAHVYGVKFDLLPSQLFSIYSTLKL